MYTFNLGYTTRMAQLAIDTLNQWNWHTSEENHCGGLLLHNFLAPFLGKKLAVSQRAANYQHVREATFSGKITLQPPILVSVTHNLMQLEMNGRRFDEAQALLDACYKFVEPVLSSSADLQASLLEKWAWLLSVWAETHNERDERSMASELRGRAIALYRQCNTLLASPVGQSLLATLFLKKRQARILNFLGYYLSQDRQYEPALQALLDSMDLQEHGQAEVDGLAPLLPA